MLKLGYDNIYSYNGTLNPYGSACWSTIYLTDDLKTFYDENDMDDNFIVSYVCNKLSNNIEWSEPIKSYRKNFLKEFKKGFNDVEDLKSLKGFLYLDYMETNLNY